MLMMAFFPVPTSRSSGTALLICIAALLSLAVAMGIGRFAFTPLFPLMVREGLLNQESGALLAVSNYLGYLVGALLAARIRLKPATLLAVGLISTVLVTAAVADTSSLVVWAGLRFAAGVASAWTLVATTAWSLGWLAALGQSQLAGGIFAGVGLGIAAAGFFCLIVAGPETSALAMWLGLALLAAIAGVMPLAVSSRLPAPLAKAETAASRKSLHSTPSKTTGLVVCYSLFGFGYILPATYLPELARQWVDDPQVFGWAWPLFGLAAALSTLIMSGALKKGNRLSMWAGCHLFMAMGVLLPVIWTSLASVVVAAFLVGGTFMVITMLGMQEARFRVPENATVILGRMTAGFALGQLFGPIVPAALGLFTADYTTALDQALTLSAAGLLASAFYLWRESNRHPLH